MSIWQQTTVRTTGLLLILTLLLAGCVLSPSSAVVPPEADEASVPRVFFTAPADGATVVSPVSVAMGAEDFTVEPSGEIRAGAGHFHIMLDVGCVAAGEVIPKDDTHLHFGGGQTEAELELAPGEHTLCLQAADGAHFALPGEGMSDEITITVQ